MQIEAVDLQPALGGVQVGDGFSNQRPEPRTVVHLGQMGHFMTRDIVEDGRWRKYEAPGERQNRCRRTRPPTASLITHSNAFARRA